MISNIWVKKPRKSAFNLSYTNLLTANFGELIPFYIQDDIIPGDQFKVNTEMLIRCSPLIAPAMVQASAYAYYFFVPNRLLWDDWQKFISPEDPNQEEVNYVFPRFIFPTVKNWETADQKPSQGDLYDYLYNIRKEDITSYDAKVTTEFSQLPMRAYKLIWNEYFRNQNVQDEIEIPKDGGCMNFCNDAVDPYYDFHHREVLKHNWHKDYFTSALPWSQRGGEVVLPLSADYAELEYDHSLGRTKLRNSSGGVLLNLFNLKGSGGSIYGTRLERSDGEGGTLDNNQHYFTDDGEPATSRLITAETSYHLNADFDVSANHRVDLTDITATTVNEFRRAIKLQEWLENSARGGGRYVESILSHFGVRVPDYTLQRPQFIGGGKVPIQFSEVLQMAPDASAGPTGTMAGHGIGVGGAPGFKKFYANEHGIIMGIMVIQPKAVYVNAMRKSLYKFDKFDYYWPEFQRLGEQPIQRKELTVWHTNAETMDSEFGYTPRYAEYMYRHSEVHGYMATTQKYWHLGRETDKTTILSRAFIQCTPAQNSSIFAVESVEDSAQFNIMLYNRVHALRPIDKYSTPSIW